MKFVQTSDWQIGKVFRIVDEATQSVLQDARVETVSKIGETAVREGADAVLVAGDVFDMEGVSTRTLDQPVERMRRCPVEWHLMAGNHDPNRPNGLWDRLMRKGLPENVKVHLEPKPAPIKDGAAWILPAPLTRMHALSDPTEWMAGGETPEEAIRIGMAHGSITQFGSDPSSTHNYIDPARPEKARLAYLAMGDWHGMKRISDRLWYSGTPETDAFDVEGGGNVLVVDIAGPKAQPSVTPVPVGRFKWAKISATIHSVLDIEGLEARLRNLDMDPGRVLVELTAAGALSLADRRLFQERIVESAGAALKWLRVDDQRLVLTPTTEDLDAIERGGFVRAAADRLKALADDPQNPAREIAGKALERLYVEHLKLTAQR